MKFPQFFRFRRGFGLRMEMSSRAGRWETIRVVHELGFNQANLSIVPGNILDEALFLCRDRHHLNVDRVTTGSFFQHNPQSSNPNFDRFKIVCII